MLDGLESIDEGSKVKVENPESTLFAVGSGIFWITATVCYMGLNPS